MSCYLFQSLGVIGFIDKSKLVGVYYPFFRFSRKKPNVTSKLNSHSSSEIVKEKIGFGLDSMENKVLVVFIKFVLINR